jgi:hypothetical protein
MESVLSISLVPFNLSPPVSLLPWFPDFTLYSNKVNTGVRNLIQDITPNVALYTALSTTTMLRLAHAVNHAMLHSSLV